MGRDPANKPEQRSRLIKVLILGMTLLPFHTLDAEQRLDLEGTAIFGNKESPNVLYVVPWRKPDPIAPMDPPGMRAIGELLAPLDRDVFLRQIDWHQTFGDKP